LANVRTRQKNTDGAIAALEQGLKVMPDDIKLTQALAVLYVGIRNLDAAATTFQQGIAAHPDDMDLLFGLASVHEQQKQFDQAISIYEQMLQKAPDNLLAVNNLAVLLSEQRGDEASMRKALDLAGKLATSQEPALLDTLGWIYYQTGDYAKAAEVLSTVVEKAPKVPVFRYHLGMTYYKQGDKRAAGKILADAVDPKYSYPGVEEARKVLAEIGPQ
jgi:tetratricopeptide (TPR) repeat protein